MSDLFSLDEKGRADLDEQVRLNPFDPSKLDPTAFEGGAEALKGLLRPSASAGRTLLVAAPSVLEVFGSGLTPEGQDWYYKNVVEGLGNRAVEAWTPQPEEMGAAAKAINVGSNVIGSVPQIIGTPGVFLADSAISPAVDLSNQGVDSDTALGVGYTNLAANAVGFRLPAAVGNTLTTRVATGAGANLVTGVAADGGSSAILSSRGYEEQAEAFKATDPYARGLDVLMGAAFGVKAHIDMQDATLVTRANDHIQRHTVPAQPAAPKAQIAHARAVTESIDQVLRDEQVDVAKHIEPELFATPKVPRETTARGATFDEVMPRVLKLEGGYVNDPVDRGGETKFGISKRAHPDVDIKALTRAHAIEIYRAEYWSAIKADSLPPDMRAVAFDAAVNQGVPWTKQALAEAGGDRAKFIALRRQRYQDIVKAKPSQKKFAKGWENRLREFESDAPMPTRQPFADPDAMAMVRAEDLGRRFSLPEEAVREIAAPPPRDSVTGFFDGRVDSMKTDLIARAQSHVDRTGEFGHFVAADLFNLGGLNEAVGNRAEVANVHYKAMAQALEAELRATGADIVPMRTGGDEFGALVINADAAAVDAAIAKAQAKVAKYAEAEGLADIPHPKRSGEKGVGLHIGRSEIIPGESVRAILDRADDGIDSSKRNVPIGSTGPARAAAPTGQARGAGGGAGSPGGGVRRAGEGVSREQGGGDAAPSGELTAVEAIAAESPQLRVLVGTDADGNPQYHTITDVLDEIRVEQQQAAQDSLAYDAAVSCVLRRGAA